MYHSCVFVYVQYVTVWVQLCICISCTVYVRMCVYSMYSMHDIVYILGVLGCCLTHTNSTSNTVYCHLQLGHSLEVCTLVTPLAAVVHGELGTWTGAHCHTTSSPHCAVVQCVNSVALATPVPHTLPCYMDVKPCSPATIVCSFKRDCDFQPVLDVKRSLPGILAEPVQPLL